MKNISLVLRKLLTFKKQYEFIHDSNGLHQIGGDIPHGFKTPGNEFPGGFQYLGFINKADKHFKWLPFSLHLICPIFTDFDFIYLDYEDPNEPKLLYPTNTADVTTAYDEITKDSYVIYNKANFSLRRFNGITEDNEFDVIGIAGKPHWTQISEVPICPKSNKKMKFVCQLTSNNPIKAKDKNFKSNESYYEKLYTELNFWCDGDLKIFFEPNSKIACYFIQNT